MLKDSIFLISSSDRNNQSFGTGFVILQEEEESYVLTCAHVFEEVGGEGKTLVNGTPAELIARGSSDGIDLAVLKVKGLFKAPPLKLQCFGERNLSVLVTGYVDFNSKTEQKASRSLKGKLGDNIVLVSSSYKGRVYAWDLKIEDDYRIKPGYSGSPVVDEDTNIVLAVASHRQVSGQRGHAISILCLKSVWQEMPENLIIPPPLISRTVDDTNVVTLISELAEWKEIHNESQSLVNSLNIPLGFVEKYRSTNEISWLEEAGYRWQELCVPKLKSIPDKWNIQRVYTPILDDLRDQTKIQCLNEISRQMMQPDIQQTEFKLLFSKLKQLYGSIWDLLSIADKRIMILIKTLQPLVKE